VWRGRLVFLVVCMVFTLTVGGATAQGLEGYTLGPVLFEENFDPYEVGVFPGAGGWSSKADTFPADQVFVIDVDPLDAGNRVLSVPLALPGTTGNTYILAPTLTSKARAFLLEFDLYIPESDYDVNYISGVYLFGATDWPPYTQLYIRPDLGTLEIGKKLHYQWIVDAETEESIGLIDGVEVDRRAFRTKGLDPSHMRFAIYTRDGYAHAYYDNIRLSELLRSE